MMAEEIEDVCSEVTSLTNSMSSRSTELGFLTIGRGPNEVAFLRMKLNTECLCYRHELSPNDEKLRLKVDTLQKSVLSYAQDNLPTHPARLEIILDRCRFLREREPQEALRLAKTTFDEAVECLDSLAEDSYKETTLALQELRDHVTVWGEEEREKERVREEEEREKERVREEARRREEEKARERERKEEEKRQRQAEMKR